MKVRLRQSSIALHFYRVYVIFTSRTSFYKIYRTLEAYFCVDSKDCIFLKNAIDKNVQLTTSQLWLNHWFRICTSSVLTKNKGFKNKNQAWNKDCGYYFSDFSTGRHSVSVDDSGGIVRFSGPNNRKSSWKAITFISKPSNWAGETSDIWKFQSWFRLAFVPTTTTKSSCTWVLCHGRINTYLQNLQEKSLWPMKSNKKKSCENMALPNCSEISVKSQQQPYFESLETKS